MTLIYQNIKYLREKQNMSQGELAGLCGYTNRSSITRIEKGQVDLQYSKIGIFAKALGTTPIELMYVDLSAGEVSSNARISAYLDLFKSFKSKESFDAMDKKAQKKYADLTSTYLELNEKGKNELVHHAQLLDKIPELHEALEA